MIFGVGLLQMVDAHLGVKGRGFQLGMAKHFLQMAHVASALQHQRGVGVAEHMADAALAVGQVDLGHQVMRG